MPSRGVSGKPFFRVLHSLETGSMQAASGGLVSGAWGVAFQWVKVRVENRRWPSSTVGFTKRYVCWSCFFWTCLLHSVCLCYFECLSVREPLDVVNVLVLCEYVTYFFYFLTFQSGCEPCPRGASVAKPSSRFSTHRRRVVRWRRRAASSQELGQWRFLGERRGSKPAAGRVQRWVSPRGMCAGAVASKRVCCIVYVCVILNASLCESDWMS